MTFDDGILKIYERVLVQDKGFMPVSKLRLKSSYYFSYEVIGVTKFYEAKKYRIDWMNLYLFTEIVQLHITMLLFWKMVHSIRFHRFNIHLMIMVYKLLSLH